MMTPEEFTESLAEAIRQSRRTYTGSFESANVRITESGRNVLVVFPNGESWVLAPRRVARADDQDSREIPANAPTST